MQTRSHVQPEAFADCGNGILTVNGLFPPDVRAECDLSSIWMRFRFEGDDVHSRSKTKAAAGGPGGGKPEPGNAAAA